MALSNKLIADYVELINQTLDSIPIESLEGFDLLKTALKESLPKPSRFWNVFFTPKVAPVTEVYQSSIQYIQGFFTSPEDYVQNPADYRAFKEIIQSRIEAKIKALENLSTAEKETYIAAQKARHAQSKRNHARMSECTRPSPTSAAHTLSETAALELQWIETLFEIWINSFQTLPSDESCYRFISTQLDRLPAIQKERLLQSFLHEYDTDASDIEDEENHNTRPRHY